MGLFQKLFLSPLDSDREEELIKLISEFEQSFQELQSHYVDKKEKTEFQGKWKPLYREIKRSSIPDDHPLHPHSRRFIEVFKKYENTINANNTAIEKTMKERCDRLLSDIDGKSLDEQQRKAVLSDADRNLVLAGAGSGKTLTIAGKIKYLCDIKGIEPEQILLIAFTKKAAEEMTERINGKLGIPVQTTTFHKLGLDIITEATGKRPDVEEDVSAFVRNYFENILVHNANEISNLIKYFAYYLKIPADLEDFDSLGDAYCFERGADFETLRSKYDREKFISQTSGERKIDRRTLLDEKVKSLEEVEIANFLFLHGVKYEYERPYPFESSDPKRKTYRPDFYLPDYDLYLEHFGVNRENKLPWLSEIEEKKYLDGMRWKREFHRENKTKLIETYSYYQSEGRLLEELEKLLKKQGVTFKEPDFADIFQTIYAKESDRYFFEFMTLCSTFITLFKSAGYRSEDIWNLNSKEARYKKPYYENRTKVFKEIIAPILSAYNDNLKEKGMVDFSDMVNHVADIISADTVKRSYRWIIIDEYQDISAARFKLVKALLDQTGAKLLCVGDDWQSIFRFAGSDITLFTRFERIFGKANILRIEKTYRNSQQLINAAGDFIKKNALQYKKSLRSDKGLDHPIAFHYYREEPGSLLNETVDRIISEHGKESSILLLGRNKYDFEIVKQSGQFTIRKPGRLVYKPSPETPFAFLTIHQAKGLEADNVVLLNFKNGTLGFPSKITDDPLLGLVLTEEEPYPYAEERRLLYVALTRTRNRIYILVDDLSPSEFTEEFKESEAVTIERKDGEKTLEVHCPVCKTGQLVLRKNNKDGGSFIGCSNYPQCGFMLNDVSVLKEPKICPSCGGILVRRAGAYGAFWGCSNYPYCEYKENTTDEGLFEQDTADRMQKYSDQIVRAQIHICPECGGELVIRTAKKGPYAGNKFYGCRNYPRCWYTKNLR